MTLAVPIALALLALPLALLLIATRRRGLAIAALPGAWARAVGPELRGHVAAGLAGRGRGQILLIAAIAAVLAVALARPLLDRAGAPPVANLAGRVIVVDLSEAAGAAEARLVARTLITAAPEIPTALVAVAADAYTVVPLTTDRRQIGRYLEVLEPTVMPAPGRALHLGLAHADAVLARAGMLVGQVVLVSAGPAPAAPVAIAESRNLRVIVPVAGPTPRWADFAGRYGAETAGPGAMAALDAALLEDAAARRAEGAGGALDLGPWLIGLALALWLGLMRRRADA